MVADTVLFDLDGTLWNSVSGISIAWQRVIDRYPYLRPPVTDDEIADCMGFSMDDIGEKIFPMVPKPQRMALLDECIKEEHAYLRKAGGRLYDGVRGTLDILRKTKKLAIISNCESGYIECFLEITGLAACFLDFECIGDSGMDKGDNILAVIDRLGSKNAVYVGDMIKDQLAAEYAGIPFIFASYGFGKGKLRPFRWNDRIESFGELLDIVE